MRPFAEMESTPNVSEDSGCVLGSFEASFESTPNTTMPSIRKRKVESVGLTDIATPQFSSTMNESLLDKIEKCKITPCLEAKPAKLAKFDSKSTPIKERGCYSESPLKEAIDILYPTKPSVPLRKSATPQKVFGGKKIYSPAKKRLFNETSLKKDPMKYFAGHSLIIAKIFANLSGGDLYRVSLVSKTWNTALFSDTRAYNRYKDYIDSQKINKENYSITPPNSPPSPDSPPVSPGSRQFHAYMKLAKTLNPNQTLRKCPVCNRPSVVEKNIAQCQNLNCGYIFCLACSSFSATGPEDFHDRCQKSLLLVDRPRRSSKIALSDLSNSAVDLPDLCLVSQNVSRDTSGYVSEFDSPVRRVKRNLNGSFSGKAGVLAESNRNVVEVHKRRRRSLAVFPVVSKEIKENVEAEPPSPPKVESVACSKQSKKNLKRLLR